MNRNEPGRPAEVGGQPARGAAPPLARGPGREVRRAAAACATPTKASTRPSSTGCSCRACWKTPAVVDKLAQAGYRGPSAGYHLLFLPLRHAVRASRRRIGVYLFVINGFDLPVMTQHHRICVGGLSLGYYAPNIYICNVADQAARARSSRLPRRPRPAADLRRIRHVDRGGAAEGQPGDRRLLDRAGRGAVAAGRRAVLPARAAHGLRGPGQARPTTRASSRWPPP